GRGHERRDRVADNRHVERELNLPGSAEVPGELGDLDAEVIRHRCHVAKARGALKRGAAPIPSSERGQRETCFRKRVRACGGAIRTASAFELLPSTEWMSPRAARVVAIVSLPLDSSGSFPPRSRRNRLRV